MASQGGEQPNISGIIRTILLVSLVTVLPGVQWPLFGWMYLFLPLVSFYTLCKNGSYSGKRLLLVSATLSLLVYLVLREFDVFIFSFMLLLTGYVLFSSAERGDSPAMSGLKCALSLAACWVVVLTLMSIGSEVSAYSQLVHVMGEGIQETLDYYRQSSNIPSDTLAELEAKLSQTKAIISLIMPSLLGSFVLFVTWITMVLGNLLLRKNLGKEAWTSYRYWQLPERVIWLVIVAAIAALLPVKPFSIIGINCLILLSMVYCFQGLAIVVFLMNKWNVPLLLRSFFYVIVIFQSVGTVILLIFGIADIWFDFRKLKKKTVDQHQK